MRKFLVVAAAFGLLAGSACSDGKKTPESTPARGDGPAAASIKASGTTWAPDDVSVKTDEVVEWVSDGSIVHDLKGDDGVSHKASSTFTVTHKYSKPGTYSYQCTIHAGMTGTVTVS
ncbi:MAG: hypothetical protein H0U92_13490 [Actinobacteria bacterium]|nr:hypothetical protein [Actinomycetota bacterium]